MTLQSLLWLLPHLCIGWAVVFLIFPGRLRANLLLKVVLGVGIGLGIGSSLYFFWFAHFSPVHKGFLIVEGVVLTGLVAALVYRIARCSKPAEVIRTQPIPTTWVTWTLISVALGFAGLSLIGFLMVSFMQPHGTFDAYAIWNLRARFIFLDSENWRAAFSPLLWWKHHPDYPLLIPNQVTRMWVLINNDSPRAPMLLAGIFTYSLVGGLFAGLGWVKDWSQASIGVLILLGTTWLIMIGVVQTGDIPITTFITLSCIILYAYVRWRNQFLLVLFGLNSGFAAWTKNEGLLFYLVCLFSVILYHLSTPYKNNIKRLIPFLLGSLFPILTVILFKTTIAPSTDIFTDRELGELLQKIVDVSSYITIGNIFIQYIRSFGGWSFPIIPVLITLSWVIKSNNHDYHKMGVRLISLTLLLTWLGYFTILLVSPHLNIWHATYAADRLVFHFFPALIFLVLTSVSSPEELLAQLRTRNSAA